MIGYIKGTIEEKYTDEILLENNAIGYRIFVTPSFLSEVSYKEEVKVHTYLSVKEDSLSLYGFKTRDELEAFKLLLSVNGVGPKAAMGLLSAFSADEFRYAVIASDAAKISKAPGIGKKTAQKIILELKDKIDFDVDFASGDSSSFGEAKFDLKSDAAADTLQALEALGYPAADALKAINLAIQNGVSQESGPLLKEALKNLLH